MTGQSLAAGEGARAGEGSARGRRGGKPSAARGRTSSTLREAPTARRPRGQGAPTPPGSPGARGPPASPPAPDGDLGPAREPSCGASGLRRVWSSWGRAATVRPPHPRASWRRPPRAPPAAPVPLPTACRETQREAATPSRRGAGGRAPREEPGPPRARVRPRGLRTACPLSPSGPPHRPRGAEGDAGGGAGPARRATPGGRPPTGGGSAPRAPARPPPGGPTSPRRPPAPRGSPQPRAAGTRWPAGGGRGRASGSAAGPEPQPGALRKGARTRGGGQVRGRSRVPRGRTRPARGMKVSGRPGPRGPSAAQPPARPEDTARPPGPRPRARRRPGASAEGTHVPAAGLRSLGSAAAAALLAPRVLLSASRRRLCRARACAVAPARWPRGPRAPPPPAPGVRARPRPPPAAAARRPPRSWGSVQKPAASGRGGDWAAAGAPERRLRGVGESRGADGAGARAGATSARPWDGGPATRGGGVGPWLRRGVPRSLRPGGGIPGSNSFPRLPSGSPRRRSVQESPHATPATRDPARVPPPDAQDGLAARDSAHVRTAGRRLPRPRGCSAAIGTRRQSNLNEHGQKKKSGHFPMGS